jgi:hypothetical protein
MQVSTLLPCCGLLRLSTAFSATVTGRFGMGACERQGVDTEWRILDPAHSPLICDMRSHIKM